MSELALEPTTSNDLTLERGIAAGYNDSPTESTSLLARLQGEGHSPFDTNVGKLTMFWQEMRTIPSYALPVFGFVTARHRMFRYL